MIEDASIQDGWRENYSPHSQTPATVRHTAELQNKSMAGAERVVRFIEDSLSSFSAEGLRYATKNAGADQNSADTPVSRAMGAVHEPSNISLCAEAKQLDRIIVRQLTPFIFRYAFEHHIEEFHRLGPG